MRKAIFAGMVAAAALAGRAEAQSALPLSVEGRLDLGVPVGDSNDVYKTGIGYGIDAALQLTPLFAVYGGYSRFDFDLDNSSGKRSSDGGEVGGRVTLGTGGGVSNPYFQFGALFHDGDTGLEAGLGTFYPVGNNLSLTPMVRYRTVAGLDYVTAGVGLNLRF